MCISRLCLRGPRPSPHIGTLTYCLSLWSNVDIFSFVFCVFSMTLDTSLFHKVSMMVLWLLLKHSQLVLQPKRSCSRVDSSLFSFTNFTCFLVWSCTGACLESEFGLIDWYNSLQHFVPLTPTCGTSFLFSCGKKTEKDKLTALLCCWDTTSHW